MRSSIALMLFLIACGSSKPPDTTSSASTTTTTSEPTAADPGGTAPATSLGTTPTPPPAPTPTPAPTPAAAPKVMKPAYSCFSYQAKNSTKTRAACMSTKDCAPYLEQAKQVAGLKEISGCATVESVWCFHTAPSKTEPDGADVCQPTADACKTERSSAVKSGTSVDSDCTQQR